MDTSCVQELESNKDGSNNIRRISENHIRSRDDDVLDDADSNDAKSHHVENVNKFVELGDPILIAVRRTLDLKYEQSASDTPSSSLLLRKTFNAQEEKEENDNDHDHDHDHDHRNHYNLETESIKQGLSLASEKSIAIRNESNALSCANSNKNDNYTTTNNSHEYQNQTGSSKGKKALIPSESSCGELYVESDDALRMFSPCSIHPVDSTFQNDYRSGSGPGPGPGPGPGGGVSKNSPSFSSSSPTARDNDKTTSEKDFFSPALSECKASSFTNWSPKRKNVITDNVSGGIGTGLDGGAANEQCDDEIRNRNGSSDSGNGSGTASNSNGFNGCTTPVKSTEATKQEAFQNRNNPQSVDMDKSKELTDNGNHERNNVLVSCSSFTQHDFTPQKASNSNVDGVQSINSGSNLNDDRFISQIATLYWRQMVARWKHNEMMKILVAKPTSHHFTKHKRSRMHLQQQVEGRLLVENPDHLNRALDWEKSLSSDSNNLNGFCPSKLLNGPEIPRISNYLQALGRLPKCTDNDSMTDVEPNGKNNERKRIHLWPGIDDSMDVLRHDVSKFERKGETTNLEDVVDYLQKMALECHDQFMKSVSEIVKFASKQSDAPSMIESSTGMKTSTSIVEKARRKYGGDILQVKDILRGRIVFPDESSLISALVHLHKTSVPRITCFHLQTCTAEESV